MKTGRLVGGGKNEDFGSVLDAMGRSSIEATESAEGGEEKTKFAFHSFGAQFCEVRVNQIGHRFGFRPFTPSARSRFAPASLDIVPGHDAGPRCARNLQYQRPASA